MSTPIEDEITSNIHEVAAEEDLHPSELYRRVALPIQANMRREEQENAKVLKGFYMAWLFDKLNLNAYR